jgi:hypothetical protein
MRVHDDGNSALVVYQLLLHLLELRNKLFYFIHIPGIDEASEFSHELMECPSRAGVLLVSLTAIVGVRLLLVARFAQDPEISNTVASPLRDGPDMIFGQSVRAIANTASGSISPSEFSNHGT